MNAGISLAIRESCRLCRSWWIRSPDHRNPFVSDLNELMSASRRVRSKAYGEDHYGLPVVAGTRNLLRGVYTTFSAVCVQPDAVEHPQHHRIIRNDHQPESHKLMIPNELRLR